jgi:hypothetical protein
MPIPVKAPLAPLVSLPKEPVPIRWGHTSVSIVGNNGQGEEISLTAYNLPAWPSVIMQPGATGLDMPAFGLFSDDSPNLDGSIFRSARATAREIMIPVYLHGIDRQTINQLKRKFFQALNPQRGYCLLKFTESGGRTRQISCYYKGGMEGSEGTDTSGFTWAKYGLAFTAMDPWFYPTRSQSARWEFGTGDPLLSSTLKFFPMRLSDGVMGGPGESLVINNPGDTEAWPTWELRGPIKSFTLTSPSGDVIKASPPAGGGDLVPVGRTLTIDTRPGKKTVKDNTGLNYWSALDTNPQFWPVAPGDTNASVSVVTGSGKAAVTLSFYPRYASYV